MTDPTAVYDRRDVVGTLPDLVVLPRDLAVRALAALRASLTARGHLAQRNTREGLGFCSWREEAPACIARRTLIDEVARLV
jgi:hypothetical protein